MSSSTETPPRATYDETLWDVKKKVENMTGTPAEKLQIFHHKRELLDEEFKDRTLDEMNLHTGFSLMAYDLVCLSHTHTLESGVTAADTKCYSHRTRLSDAYIFIRVYIRMCV